MTQQHNEGVSGNVEETPVAPQTDHLEASGAPEGAPEVEEESLEEEDPKPEKPDWYPDGDWESLSEKDAKRVKGMRRAAERIKAREEAQAQELAYMRAQFEQMAPLIQQFQQSQTPELVEPNYADYDDDQKFIADKVAYETQKILRANQAEQQKTLQERQRAVLQQQQIEQQWQGSINTLRRAVPDFDAKVEAAKELAVPTGTSAALKQLGPAGAPVYNYLLDNPDIAEDLMIYEGNPQAVYQQLQAMVPLAYASLATPRAVQQARESEVSGGVAPAPKTAKRGGAKQKTVYDPNLSTAERMKMLREIRTKR